MDRVDEFYAEDFTADYTFTDWGAGVEEDKVLAARIRVGLPDHRKEIKFSSTAVNTLPWSS